MELVKGILLGILLLFVVLFIILMIYYFVTKNKMDNSITSGSMLPPPEYMRSVGIRCPDYWEDLGTDPSNTNKHICRNTYNIPVANVGDTSCYDDQGQRTKSFTTAENSDFNGNMTQLKEGGNIENERCRFVQRCGPTPNEDASWLGIMSGKNSYSRCLNIP